jgi:hypothetical protein
MKKSVIKLSMLSALMAILCLISLCVIAGEKAERKLPDLKPQPTAEAVVKEHLTALNAYDWQRLMAQYPEQIEIHLPNGGIVGGRQAVADMFEGMCKPYEQGGFKGAVFTAVHTTQVGNTLMVQWVVNAPFLADSYRGADAFVTKNGLMYGQVTTFNGADIKFKKVEPAEQTAQQQE